MGRCSSANASTVARVGGSTMTFAGLGLPPWAFAREHRTAAGDTPPDSSWQHHAVVGTIMLVENDVELREPRSSRG
jgi:hypothetical protein